MSIDNINNSLEKAKLELVNWYNNEKSDEKDKAYAVKHSAWINEKQVKNRIIRFKKSDEKVQRKRKHVYWSSVGMNVGSELSEDHFVVVVKEFPTVAVVIPLSSVKPEHTKSEALGYYEIGKVDGLPVSSRNSFAVVSQIKTMSKKRLSSYRLANKEYLTIILSDEQMDIIDKALVENLTNLEIISKPTELLAAAKE